MWWRNRLYFESFLIFVLIYCAWVMQWDFIHYFCYGILFIVFYYWTLKIKSEMFALVGKNLIQLIVFLIFSQETIIFDNTAQSLDHIMYRIEPIYSWGFYYIHNERSNTCWTWKEKLGIFNFIPKKQFRWGSCQLL